MDGGLLLLKNIWLLKLTQLEESFPFLDAQNARKNLHICCNAGVPHIPLINFFLEEFQPNKFLSPAQISAYGFWDLHNKRQYMSVCLAAFANDMSKSN